jgi:hypothetical protein
VYSAWVWRNLSPASTVLLGGVGRVAMGLVWLRDREAIQA